jgi:hypothetical protein
MAYPQEIDKFTEKLNKLDNNTYVIEEKVEVTDGVYEGELEHDNISLPSINVYTGSKLTGQKIDNFIVSTPSATPWKTNIKIFSDISPVYITYQTQGDTVEAEDINKVQDSVVNTQLEMDRYKTSNDNRVTDTENRITTVENNKSEKTYVDTELNKRYLKTETYNKTETDQRIQMVVDAAPEALDTLKEIANALNNDPDFAATITTALSKKVDKVDGKQLSTEDYTTTEKQKLAGIEEGANKYVHPATHPATMITTDSTHEFVEDGDISNWNDANSQKHTHNNFSILQTITQTLIDAWNTVSNKSDVGHKHAKADITDFPASMPANGGNADTLDNIDSTGFFRTGIEILANADLNNYTTAGDYFCRLNATAITISNTPPKKEAFMLTVSQYKTSSSEIGAMQIWKHYATNTIYFRVYNTDANTWTSWAQIALKSDIPSIPTKVSQLTNDGDGTSSFVTASQLGDAGYGDMTKAIYDTDNNGVVDSAETVPWSGISGKPSTFTPSSHTHSISNITGLQTALDNKMAKGPVTWNDLKGV